MTSQILKTTTKIIVLNILTINMRYFNIIQNDKKEVFFQ